MTKLKEFVQGVKGCSLIVFPCNKDIRLFLKNLNKEGVTIFYGNGVVVVNGVEIILITTDGLQDKVRGCRFNSIGVVTSASLTKSDVNVLKGRLIGEVNDNFVLLDY